MEQRTGHTPQGFGEMRSPAKPLRGDVRRRLFIARRFDRKGASTRIGLSHMAGSTDVPPQKGALGIMTWLWHGSPWRALSAGILYGFLYVLATQTTWRVARRLGGMSSVGAIRLHRWPGWPWLGRSLGLLFSVAYPTIMVADGTFASRDVGLGSTDWRVALPWVASVTAGFALWLILLWGIYERKRPGRMTGEATVRPLDRWLVVLTGVVIHEAMAVTLRAALMPLAGRYWGIWLGVLAKLLLSHADPWMVARLRNADRRAPEILNWALDWVSATLYALSGSLYASLLGRAICQIGAWATLWRKSAPQARAEINLSADNQSQHHQKDEHASRENAETL